MLSRNLDKALQAYGGLDGIVTTWWSKGCPWPSGREREAWEVQNYVVELYTARGMDPGGAKAVTEVLARNKQARVASGGAMLAVGGLAAGAAYGIGLLLSRLAGS